jgi:hypothetical protein
MGNKGEKKSKQDAPGIGVKPAAGPLGKADKTKLAALAPDPFSFDTEMKSASYFIVKRAQEKQQVEKELLEMEEKASVVELYHQE